jgi:hypothetical protein
MIHQSLCLDLEHAVKVSDQVKNTEHLKNKKGDVSSICIRLRLPSKWS